MDPARAGVALVIGAGENLGGAIARRFARAGNHVVATRRRGDLSRLQEAIVVEGGACTAIHMDARQESEVVDLFDRVERDLGPIQVMVFNVGGNVRFPLMETTSRVYRKSWEMCAYAGFLVVREAAIRMTARGEGSILLTGATASIRGGAGFVAFSGGKHALRALAQSAARELGPKGIHVAHVVIDGPIDSESTRHLFPELFTERPPEGILKPDDIAEIYWQLHCQPRSAWSFETDVRTHLEPWQTDQRKQYPGCSRSSAGFNFDDRDIWRNYFKGYQILLVFKVGRHLHGLWHRELRAIQCID